MTEPQFRRHFQFSSHLQKQPHVEHVTIIHLEYDKGMSNHHNALLMKEGLQLACKPMLLLSPLWPHQPTENQIADQDSGELPNYGQGFGGSLVI